MANKTKDYVSNPKANGYRSIHIVAQCNDQPLEVQIRSENMHKQAEYGASGHWSYKVGIAAEPSADAVRAAYELFDGIDADRDGSIGAGELVALLDRVGVQATLE